MKLYNVNIYKEITFICGYYGENDLVNKVLSHVCTHLSLIYISKDQYPSFLFNLVVLILSTYFPNLPKKGSHIW